MAEIEVKGGKKGAPRIDLTPMVDLGFLLITFFMFTTTMSKPKAMEIQMPFKDEKLDEKNQSKIKTDQALTVLLSKDHRVYYYGGIGDDPANPPKVEVTYFKDKDGLRQVLIDKKKAVQALVSQGVLKPTDKLVVLIKPDDDSTTGDLINALDEMTINGVPIYAVVDITPVDKDFIHATEAANQ
ncbi:MAG: biopolymer transporter ExbD [Edaphocola sp.]